MVKFIRALFSCEIVGDTALREMMTSENLADADVPEQTELGMQRLVIEGGVHSVHTGTIPRFGASAFYCPEKEYYIAQLGHISFLDQGHILGTIIGVIHK